ncbi:MAG: IS6 family transposase [Thermoplasmata archaeon]|jgi:transposase-like protein|nr:IS6 family transposase [Thermoplasmata archaeon]
MLDLLVKLFEERKIFRRKRKDWKIKALAILLYFAGLSYRKTSKILRDFEIFSYEAVRKWYHKCKDLFIVKKKRRRVVAIDETKVKLENEQIYVWNAIDVDEGTILAVHVSTTRTSFDAYYFLRRVLDTCENKPLILVDKGPWYRWALQRLGLKYKHETFGERNAIEGWYSLFKARVKRFWKRFPVNSSLESVKRWSVAWACLYNLEVLS